MPQFRVALVEDDSATRASWISWLRIGGGFVCSETFPSADEALLRWRNDLAHIAVVDLLLPGTNGIDCITQLKARFPELRFLVVTVVDDSRMIFKALKAGAHGYVLKSASSQEFRRSIVSVLRGGTPLSPGVARQMVQHFHRLGDKNSNLASLEVLSKREHQVLAAISKGLTNKEIANELGITVHTVKVLARRIYVKLHVTNRAGAAARFQGESE